MKNIRNKKAFIALAAVLALQIAALAVISLNIKSFAATEADMVFFIKGFSVKDGTVTANFDYPKPIPEGAKFALVETADGDRSDEYDYGSYISIYNFDCKVTGYTDERPEPGVLYIPVKMLTEPITEDEAFYYDSDIDEGTFPDSTLEVSVWLHDGNCEIYSVDFDGDFYNEHVHYEWDE